MARIAILHPGAMGASIGGALVDVGHDVVWLPTGRSDETRRRAEDAGLRAAGDLSDCDLIISVCPPGAAAEVAADVAALIGTATGSPTGPPTATGASAATDTSTATASIATTPPTLVRPPRAGLFLDANAIAPSTAVGIARRITSAGLTYVDGGIVGPPPHRSGTTRLFLSGAEAPAVTELFAGARIGTRIVSDAGPTAASAVKMTYAAWSKIGAALLLAADGAAAALGVQPALHAEWALSQPEVADRLVRARAAAAEKGWRWEAEMLEIATTFDQAGGPGAFGRAAADIFGGFRRPEGEAARRPAGPS